MSMLHADTMNGKRMDQRSSHIISILKTTSLLSLLLCTVPGKIQKVTNFSLHFYVATPFDSKVKPVNSDLSLMTWFVDALSNIYFVACFM